MIHQDMSWYDDPKNAVAALSMRITSDAASVQGVTYLFLIKTYIQYVFHRQLDTQ